LHGYYFEFLGQRQGFDAPKSFQKKHLKTGFEEMEWGILKRRVQEGGTEESDDWKVGHPLVFPFYMRVGGAGIDQMQIRVPIDETTTWKLFYSLHHPDGGVWEQQDRPVVYEYQWRDEQGRFINHGSDSGAPGPFGRRSGDVAQDVQGEHEEGRQR
ncbi:MAG: hypothetical protein VW362_05080, partial [Candidatus Nanopelagicales bacterium]